VKEAEAVLSSLTETLEIAERTGALLTGLTVRVKVFVSERAPSERVTVIVDDPC
jgi:hypothetical protein